MPMKPGTRRKEYIQYSCAYCGKPGECAPSWAKGKAKLFCRGEGQDCKGKYQAAGNATLPKGSFMLRPDAAAKTAEVRRLIEAGKSGPQIQGDAALTRGELQGILKRESWTIKKNLGVVDLTPNTECVSCKKPLRRTPSEMRERNFCGNVCKAKGFSLSITRSCVQCAKVFPVRSHAVKTMCCSYPCSVQYRTQQRNMFCQHCGEEMKPKGPKDTRRYCSKICSGAAATKKIDKTCVQCGIIKPVNTCHAERNAVFTCSTECILAYRNTNQAYRAARSANQSAAIRRKWQEDLVWAQARRTKLSAMSAARIAAGYKGSSSAEIACARILEALDIHYEAEYLYESAMFASTKSYDFFLPDYDVLVEVHGTYWHADARAYPDRENLDYTQLCNLDNDTNKIIIAHEEMNKRLIVIWEMDLQEDSEGVAKVFEALKQNSQPHSGD